MQEFMKKVEKCGINVPEVMERFMGDEDLYRDCFMMLFDDTNMSELEQNLSNQKYRDAFNNAHTLKGITGNLGITQLYKKVCDLVEDLRSEKYANVNDKFLIVKEEYQELVKAFK